MTPDAMERLAVLVERQLAGLSGPGEIEELSKLLESSPQARELYLRAMEFHVDLGAAADEKARAAPSTPTIPLPVARVGRSAESVPLPETRSQKRFLSWSVRLATVSVAAGFLLVGSLFGFWLIGRIGGPPPPDPNIATAPGMKSARPRPESVMGNPQPDTPPPLPPPPSVLVYNEAQLQELRRQVRLNYSLMNMTGIVAELMRLRNLTNEWAQFQADMANYESKIKYSVGELAKVGEKMSLDTYLAQGDQFLGFAQSDFTSMKAADAAQVLSTWLANWRSGSQLEQINIQRGDRKLTIYVQFPEQSNELLVLLRHPALEVALAIPTDLLALHPFYLGLVLSPAEKARIGKLSSTGRGAPADADFVASVLSSAKLKAVTDEIAHISQMLPILERESQENLPVDKVTLIDSGRVLHCKVLEESVEVVKVGRLGIQMPLRKDAIQRIEKGKGIGREFAIRWESVQKGGVASQVELLGWCKENTLANQVKLVAYTILRSDPGHSRARTEAGLPPDPIKHQEAVAAGGVISYQGKSWNAGELKEKFIKDGYCLLEGKWYSKKDKLITVPGLFRYERQDDKPVIFGGSAGLCHETETTYKQALDPGTQNYVEQAETKLLRRFYAPPMTVTLTPTLPPGIVPPRSTYELDVRVDVDAGNPPPGTPMKAEVTIQVPVGAPILEASVTTKAEVKAGGSIAVYHVTDEKRTQLYTCEPNESQQHAIPMDLVRGRTEVNLVAVIEEPATYIPRTERRRFRNAIMRAKTYLSPAVDILHYKQIPDYKAVLFPSNANTIEVFRLKLKVAEPAPMLDKLFANCPEILK